MTDLALDQWSARLEAVATGLDGAIDSIVVLRETDSTQLAARRLGLTPGAVITTGRQNAGRGRLGRAWSDGEGTGVAVTLVRRDGNAEQLAISAAVGVASAIEPLVDDAVGIKWPNDIVVRGRKLAGILIERTANRLLLGIGVNVGAARWRPELADRAISLHELGAPVDRVDVLAGLLTHVIDWERRPPDVLTAAFAERDVLAGTTATFRCGDRQWHGRVERIDPLRGLELRVQDEAVWLPAATTRTVSGDE